MLERDEELERLGAALADVRAGRGRLIVIEGPAGRGKSSLLAALAQRADASGMQVLSGRGGELERGFAFGTIRQVFERAVGEATPTERERLLAGAAAPAASILGAEATARAESEFGVLHAVYWLATNLSLRRPLLIAVDDLHWVDEPSLRALSYLARRLEDVGIAVVVALRPAEPGAPQELLDTIRSTPDALTTRVAPLSFEAVATLVTRAVPDADDALREACFEATAGNPFYLRELLVSLDGGVGAQRARRAATPELGERIVRRIDRIGPQAAALAQAMAVLGDGAALDAAAAVAEVDGATAAALAARLHRIEILSAEDPFAFVHPLVRRSVYDILTLAERDRLHMAAAHVLAERGALPGVVATHLERVRPAGSTEVAQRLRAAAAAAVAGGAPDAAGAALRRAIDEGAAEPSQAELLCELGEVELLAQDVAAAEHLRAALDLAQEPDLRGRAAMALSVILGAMGRWDELLTTIPPAIAALDEDSPYRLELEGMRAIVLGNDRDHVDEYTRDLPRLLRLARGDSWEARALCAMLASKAAERGVAVDEIRPLLDHALADGVLLGQRGAAPWPAGPLLGAVFLVEEYDRAFALLDEIAIAARRGGSAHGALLSLAFRAWGLLAIGDLRGAEAELQTIVAMGPDIGLQMNMASYYWILHQAVGERPAFDAIVAETESATPAGDFARTIAGAMVFDVRGRWRLVHGDRPGAIADLRAAADVYRPLLVGPLRSHWRSALAVALPAEDRQEALALVDEEVALARETGSDRTYGMALRAAATLRRDADEIDTLRRSVELLADTPARLERARSLLALGSALRRRGNRAEARDPLREAVELAHRCGAGATGARAAEELRATGARPRGVTRMGVDALTVSEARVARLVVAGRSNAEVAQELFVSLKTVETHLSRVYSKLDLSGPGARRRLASVLEA